MIYTLENFLTVDECRQVRTLFAEPHPGVAYSANKNIRQSEVCFIPRTPHATWLYSKMWNVLQRANARLFDFDICDTERLQIAAYEEGGGYDWHTDMAKENALRKLSVSVQITPPDEYDGGDLEVWGISPIERAQGTAIVFPSYMLHRVVPVTRGRRQSLVAWAIGRRHFR